MKTVLGKRFILGMVALICSTVVICHLRMTDENALKMILGIVGAFMSAQTITDYKTKGGAQ